MDSGALHSSKEFAMTDKLDRQVVRHKERVTDHTHDKRGEVEQE